MGQKPHFHQWSGWREFSKNFDTRWCTLYGCDIREDREVKTGHTIRHHGDPVQGEQAACLGEQEDELKSSRDYRAGGLC